jgi:hypothetical protein
MIIDSNLDLCQKAVSLISKEATEDNEINDTGFYVAGYVTGILNSIITQIDSIESQKMISIILNAHIDILNNVAMNRKSEEIGNE